MSQTDIDELSKYLSALLLFDRFETCFSYVTFVVLDFFYEFSE